MCPLTGQICSGWHFALKREAAACYLSPIAMVTPVVAFWVCDRTNHSFAGWEQ
ncbi:MAG: hypothetical protein J07HR59_00833 [Halorubrum sp. J07HR59]|nr:MAG: hypothetical protein J07HR59_00833 [Halorubrum sp. J07HR59]